MERRDRNIASIRLPIADSSLFLCARIDREEVVCFTGRKVVWSKIFLSKCIKSVVNLTAQNLSEINISAYIKSILRMY